MGLLTYTYTAFPDGTVAYGTYVITNFQEIQTVLNGGIDNDNVTNAGLTLSTKGVAGSVDSALMGAASVKDAALEYDSADSGVKVWQLGPNYPGAGGGRMIRVEKSVTIAAATTVQDFAVDWSTADGVDGNTTFTVATPLVIHDWFDSNHYMNAAIEYERVIARSATGATIRIKFSAAPTGGAVTLMMLVSGAM
jgi:hypothetical protein